MIPRLLIQRTHTQGADEAAGKTPLEAIWHAGQTMALPESCARHVQVLRLQPGDALILFDGQGGEWAAEVVSMGRRDVQARLVQHIAIERELGVKVTLAIGMPANDRMDALVEKATELGAWAIQPLVCMRSVLRLDGERAAKKVAHWQSVVDSACEQSGRTRVPRVHAVLPLKAWLAQMGAAHGAAMLSFAPQMQIGPWVEQRLRDGLRNEPAFTQAAQPVLSFLSGPEGGLTPEEEALAVSAGWTPVGLGPRVLRADTAPLMALSMVAGLAGSDQS